MATETSTPSTSAAAILSRLIRPEDPNFTREAAESLLRIRFDPSDLDRMHQLAVRNQEDSLTASEETELDNYRQVSFLLDLIHSKARRSIMSHNPTA